MTLKPTRRYFLAAAAIAALLAFAGCGGDTDGDAASTIDVIPTSTPAPGVDAETDTGEATVEDPTTDTQSGDDATSTGGAQPEEPTVEPTPQIGPTDPFVVNAGLAKTMNLGATFEVGPDEDWGEELVAADYPDIAAQGFTAVRIPIKFSAWAEAEAPYAIDETFLASVDEAVELSLDAGLAVIIDLHHYDEIFEDPEAHGDRLAGMWLNIAERYKALPTDTVSFEVLNEPNQALTPEFWNPILGQTVEAIRTVDPNRTLIVGPTEWYAVAQLENFALPDDDNLILTFHYYEPFRFTHQGAGWLPGTDEWLGTTFSPDDEAAATIDADFATVAEWANERNLPVFLGEFGVITNADPQSRLAWLRFIREAADIQGFSWAVWDWTSFNFGLRDPDTKAWNDDALSALVAP